MRRACGAAPSPGAGGGRAARSPPPPCIRSSCRRSTPRRTRAPSPPPCTPARHRRWRSAPRPDACPCRRRGPSRSERRVAPANRASRLPSRWSATARRAGRCGPIRPSRRSGPASASGSIRPCSPSTRESFAPPVKNSGAPHSSASICAMRWHRIASQGFTSPASASAFAAVPDRYEQHLRLGPAEQGAEALRHLRHPRVVAVGHGRAVVGVHHRLHDLRRDGAGVVGCEVQVHHAPPVGSSIRWSSQSSSSISISESVSSIIEAPARCGDIGSPVSSGCQSGRVRPSCRRR